MTVHWSSAGCLADWWISRKNFMNQLARAPVTSQAAFHVPHISHVWPSSVLISIFLELDCQILPVSTLDRQCDVYHYQSTKCSLRVEWPPGTT